MPLKSLPTKNIESFDFSVRSYDAITDNDISIYGNLTSVQQCSSGRLANELSPCQTTRPNYMYTDGSNGRRTTDHSAITTINPLTDLYPAVSYSRQLLTYKTLTTPPPQFLKTTAALLEAYLLNILVVNGHLLWL